MNIVDPKLLRKNDEVEAYSEREFGASEGGASGINLDFLFDFARRHVWTIVCCVLLTSGLGVAYFLAVPAPYTAVATLTIDIRKFQLFQQQELAHVDRQHRNPGVRPRHPQTKGDRKSTRL